MKKIFYERGGGLELYLPVEETSRSDSRLWIFYWRLTGVWSSQLNNSENSTFWNISLKILLDLHIRISRIHPKLWGCRVKEHVKKSKLTPPSHSADIWEINIVEYNQTWAGGLTNTMPTPLPIGLFPCCPALIQKPTTFWRKSDQ